MQHDQRQRSGVLRDLIEGVEVVAVECLPFGGWLVVVVQPRLLHDASADSEAALFLDDKRTAGIAWAVGKGCASRHRAQCDACEQGLGEVHVQRPEVAARA